MYELWPKDQIKELLQKRHYKNRINFEAMGIKQSGFFYSDILRILLQAESDLQTQPLLSGKPYPSDETHLRISRIIKNLV